MIMKKVRNFIDNKIKEISKESLILDLGGGKPFTKWMKKYKPLFSNCNYKTVDFDKSLGADIICDIHNITMSDNSVDAVICSSVLEHVENPIKVVSEIYRILKLNGVAFIYVPSIYPYHARGGHYKDYWRFFDDTIYSLFKEFREIEIKKFGAYFTALSFFFPIQHKFRFILNPVASFLDKLFKMEERTTTAGYFIFIKK